MAHPRLDRFGERFALRFPHLIGQRILVALSGGPDSVALLHLLHESQELRLDLAAAHVHHSARGTEADEDAAFCRRLCDALQVPFHLVRLEPGAPAAEGREAAWRVQRYRALGDVKTRIGAAAVATGHHRDDVAEGVLMQLLRGAGPRAVAGIASETATGIVRPLLDWSRNEILEWLHEGSLSWREDSSNRDLSHLRNRVRHIVLPDLRTASPQIDRHLVAFAHAVASDERYLASELERFGRWIEPWAPDGGLPIEVLRDLPDALRTRWLHAQAARVGIARVSRRQLELFQQLIEQGAPRAVTLGGRWRLRIVHGRLWLEPPQTLPPYSVELIPGTTVSLPMPGWEVRVGTRSHPDGDATWSMWLRRERVLSVRSAAPGDEVADSSGARRVRKLLARVAPRHLRRSWPVLCENDTIAWIPGIWQAHRTGNLLVEVVAHGGAASRLRR